MIPKKIHFCWLSGDEYPPLIKHCLETWHKILPDYEIVLWDTNKFDINSVPWVKEAYEAKKYAFAADYIRFYALYTEGGIYLDSDVEVLKSFNPLLNAKSFIGYEASTNNLEAAIVGAEAGTDWCNKILDFYKNKHFSTDLIRENILAPVVVGTVLRPMYPEIPIIPPREVININNGELMLYPTESFSPIVCDIEKSYSGSGKSANKYYKNKNTYCIHRFNGSWTKNPALKLQLIDKTKKSLYNIFGEKQTESCLDVIRILLGKK